MCSSLPLHRSKPLYCSGICPLPFPQTGFGSAVHTIPGVAVKSSSSDSERKQKEGQKVLAEKAKPRTQHIWQGSDPEAAWFSRTSRLSFVLSMFSLSTGENRIFLSPASEAAPVPVHNPFQPSKERAEGETDGPDTGQTLVTHSRNTGAFTVLVIHLKPHHYLDSTTA